MTRVAVIGGGHNGLVCACFLTNAGLDVTVFEANETPGGCVWTEELPSGHRLERGAIEHGPILGIVDELELARYGLEYVFRDVTAAAGYGDGTRLIFRKDLQATIDGLGSLPPEDLSGYEKLARIGADLFGMMDGFAIGPSPADISRLGPIGTLDPLQIILGSSGKLVGAHVTDPYLAGALHDVRDARPTPALAAWNRLVRPDPGRNSRSRSRVTHRGLRPAHRGPGRRSGSGRGNPPYR